MFKPNDTYDVSHKNVSDFDYAIIVTADETIVVHNPTMLYTRKDGKTTVRSGHGPAHTRTARAIAVIGRNRSIKTGTTFRKF